MAEPDEVRRLVAAYELRSSYGSEPHFDAIRALGAEVVPYFLEAYPGAGRWQQRASFLYASIRHARTCPAAVELAVLALGDRSSEVRYRACMLLAVSLDRAALPSLRDARIDTDDETRGHIDATIDAIEHGNPDWFVDRDHSGKIHLNVEQVTG